MCMQCVCNVCATHSVCCVSLQEQRRERVRITWAHTHTHVLRGAPVCVQVTELYSTSSWQHINEHLHEVLGRQCAELADGPGEGTMFMHV
jgi:hypothetical protein